MVGRVDSVFGTSFKKKSDLSSFFPYLRDDFHYQNKFLGNSKKKKTIEGRINRFHSTDVRTA